MGAIEYDEKIQMAKILKHNREKIVHSCKRQNNTAK